jgi:tyrosine phenol-lyase
MKMVFLMERYASDELADVIEGRVRPYAEPYRAKMVEIIKCPTYEERCKAMERAGYNTFLLDSNDVYIDLLTDSGTNAMSDYQWAGMMRGDEAYAGSRSFDALQQSIRDVYGYTYIVPTHQGRGAEHLLSQAMISEGDVVPGNMYFTTTRLHQELAGGAFHDVIDHRAHDTSSDYPFKGEVDVFELQKCIEQHGAGRIPYICIGAPVNMAGGQPISLKNLREVRELAERYRIPLVLDMARVAENAYLIQQKEERYAGKNVKEIVREICDLTDSATMSAKKDPCVNIGGFLATNDKELYQKAKESVVIYEGLHTYGGLAGRDMEAIALGIHESVDNDYMRARVEQVQYLWNQLNKKEIPLVAPCGGHGVYLNARDFYPQIPQFQYPAQTLAAEIYLDSGVRTMERGIVSAGRGSDGQEHTPSLELVRVTLPRRVYSNSHMDYVADSIASVYERRYETKGLKITHEPEHLRFFQAEFNRL